MNIKLFITCFIILSTCHLEAQNSKGWKDLFNGENLNGWSVIGGQGKVEVEDNAIVLRQTANTKEHTFVHTKKKYKNFILEVDCKRDPRFFYGILFRAQKAPDTAHVRLYGYQSKVDHKSDRSWTGGIFDDFGNTWNWMYTPDTDERAKKALKPSGEWDHYHIEAIDNTIKVWLNDIPISNIQNAKYKKGYIAFKIHFLGNNKEQEKQRAWIKNVCIVTSNLSKYTKTIDIPMLAVH